MTDERREYLEENLPEVRPLLHEMMLRLDEEYIKRNFNLKERKEEEDRIATADSLMKIAVKKYRDVYYIYPVAHSEDHNATVDGTHPDNYGYTLWAKSIEKKIVKILKKYGIR